MWNRRKCVYYSFFSRLTTASAIIVNQYSPYSNLILTCGMPNVTDPNLLTILFHGDVPGLQFFVGEHGRPYVWEFVSRVRLVQARLLELIRQGLNLEQDYCAAVVWGNHHYFPHEYRLKPSEPYILINGSRYSTTIIPFSEACFRHGRTALVEEVMTAANVGMFQLIDHGIPDDLMHYAMRKSAQFFEMPLKEIYKFWDRHSEERMLYTSSMKNYNGEDLDYHFWRDALTLTCNTQQPRPSQPTHFMDSVWEFVSRVRRIQDRLLELFCEGLALPQDYFTTSGLNESSTIVVNRYPRCLQLTRAIGMAPHGDPNLFTFSVQEGPDGLQILHDDEWKFVVLSPNALLVTVGRLLQFVSGDVVKAAEHRVVVNSTRARTSLSLFMGPKNDCVIRPPHIPTSLTLSPEVGPRYRQFTYEEFITKHIDNNRNPSSIVPQFKSRR